MKLKITVESPEGRSVHKYKGDRAEWVKAHTFVEDAFERWIDEYTDDDPATALAETRGIEDADDD